MEQKDWDNIAKEYHKEVISPFQSGVRNPLFKKLTTIKNTANKVVADIGCGRGDILDLLASKFKRVYAIDFSPVMIEIAKEQSLKKNIKYHVRDMRHLKEFNNKFDVVISVNSILMPKIIDVNESLKSIHSCLSRNGKFYGIFPSMGSILYQAFLILEEEINKSGEEKKALRNTRKILENRKYNFINGTFNDGGQIQKFYYDFELKLRLKNAGFKNIKISKVLYPWRRDISDFIIFPGKPKMWDLFVSAEK